MRRFIRHPVSMPIDFRVQGERAHYSRQLENVSEGGICFQSSRAVEPGVGVKISIPVAGRDFHADGMVTWCRRDKGHYQVGVRFNDSATAYTMRMVEQLCHIEDFRREVSRVEGRDMSPAQAAAEWVSRYAEKFPH